MVRNIQFEFFSGARSGELYTLKFEDIEIDIINDKKFINITGSYCFTSKEIKSPKNGKSRMVPINNSLETLIMQRKKKANSEFVFDRDSEWEAGKAPKYLRAYQNNLEIKTCNFHGLRSAFITEMLLAGCVLVILQEIVGHASYATTQIYVRQVQTQRNLKNITNLCEPKRGSNLTLLNPLKTAK
jgi:integrase